jgi:cytochrome P450
MEATVTEISRINPTAPMSVPHKALKDTELGGYTIKKVIHVVTMLLSIYLVHG